MRPLGRVVEVMGLRPLQGGGVEDGGAAHAGPDGVDDLPRAALDPDGDGNRPEAVPEARRRIPGRVGQRVARVACAARPLLDEEDRQTLLR
jgi:hypothetical protein